MANTETDTISINDYVVGVLKQDGLYIGLGLGAVVGALVASQNIESALEHARDILKATESLTAGWNAQITNNHS